MRNTLESQYDATRTSDTKILHFRDKVEGDGGRSDERPKRLSDLRAHIKPRSMPRVTLRAGNKRETYRGGPLAETEEAHGLIKGLEEAFGRLCGRWSTLERGRSDRK